jgi:uncharacterized protein GlcG (DUF336 family)
MDGIVVGSVGVSGLVQDEDAELAAMGAAAAVTAANRAK